jgi:hypothetical protein
MKNNIKMYGQEFDLGVINDINNINEKLENEKDPEEILKLRMQRLYRGMEMNTSIYKRNYRNYFPY